MVKTTFVEGDIVRVKTDADDLNDLGFVSAMHKYRGNEYTVVATMVSHNSHWYYLDNCIDNDNCYWTFDDAWLELVKSLTTYEVTENDIEGLLCLK